jgi:hypothetical protein
MNKISVLIFTIIAGSALLLSPTRSAAVEIMAGGSIGWEEWLGFYQSKPGSKDTMETYDSMRVSGILDVQYARFTVGYGYHVLRYVVDTNGTEEKKGNRRIGNVNVSALGKYPFSFLGGTISAWPAIGAEYSINTLYKIDGTDMKNRYNRLNDLYVTIGGGGDYFINTETAVTGSLLFGWNLTPETSSNSALYGTDYQSMNMVISLGLLKKL